MGGRVECGIVGRSVVVVLGRSVVVRGILVVCGGGVHHQVVVFGVVVVVALVVLRFVELHHHVVVAGVAVVVGLLVVVQRYVLDFCVVVDGFQVVCWPCGLSVGPTDGIQSIGVGRVILPIKEVHVNGNYTKRTINIHG